MLASNLEVLFFSCPVETPLTIRSSNDVASRNSSSKACWIRFRSVLSIVTAYTCSVRCIHLLSEVGHNLRWRIYSGPESKLQRELSLCRLAQPSRMDKLQAGTLLRNCGVHSWFSPMAPRQRLQYLHLSCRMCSAAGQC